MTSFRVIIVGGGPAGLTLALSLTLAKIDFVILERRDDIADRSGAGILLMPNALRILDQVGVYQNLLAAAAVEITTMVDTVSRGRVASQKQNFLRALPKM